MAEPMQAGREMDAVVAERVMGRRATMLPTSLSEADPHVVDYSISRGFSRCPSYSTSIAAAWEVVEKMDSLGWYLTLDRLHQKEAGRFWRCEWMKYTEEDERCGDCWEDGDTPAHAICRAALQALASVPPAPAGKEEGA